MAAPEGNQFWKLRSKHGRDKLFESPDLLLEAAQEYFQWCDENPWIKNDAVKGGDMAGVLIKIPTARPYTLSGLCVYIGANESYWRNFKKDNKIEGFSAVITHVEEVIRTQKFEGAAVGAFNANIIARDLGLSEKTELNASLYVEQITGMRIAHGTGVQTGEQQAD